MSFTPINHVQETEDEIDEHIREVKLEEALKLYQKTLKDHSSGRLEDAIIGYEALIESEIVQDLIEAGPEDEAEDEDAWQSEINSGSRLPYLAFRNHGNALLQLLKQDIVHLAAENVRAQLVHILHEYATALSFDGSDDRLWQTVLDLARRTGLKKAVKLSLERDYDQVVAETEVGIYGSEDAQAEALSIAAHLADLAKEVSDTAAQSLIPATPGTRQESGGQELQWLPAIPPELNAPVADANDFEHISVDLSHRNWYRFGRILLEKQRIMRRTAPVRPTYITLDLPTDDPWSLGTKPSQAASTASLVDDESEADALETARPMVFERMSEASGSPTLRRAMAQHSPEVIDLRSDVSVDADETIVAKSAPEPAEPAEIQAQLGKRALPAEAEEEHSTRTSKRQRRQSIDEKAPSTPANAQLLDLVHDKVRTLGVQTETFEQLYHRHIGGDTAYTSRLDELANVVRALLGGGWTDALQREAFEQAAKGSSRLVSSNLMLNFPVSELFDRSVEMTSDSIRLLREMIELRAVHHRQVGVVYLQAILGGETTSSPYTTTVWPDQLREVVLDVLHVEELSTRQILREALEADQPVPHALLAWAQAAIELLIDALIDAQRGEADNSETVSHAQQIEHIAGWQRTLTDLFCRLDRDASSLPLGVSLIRIRHRWSMIVMSQLSGADSESILEQYQRLQADYEKELSIERLPLPNCRFISILSMARLQTEISKFQTVDFFATVFRANTEGNSEQVLNLLRPVLLDEDAVEAETKAVVGKYLAGATWRFGLELWSMLAEGLVAAEEHQNAALASFEALAILRTPMANEEFVGKTPDAKKELGLYLITQVVQHIFIIFEAWQEHGADVQHRTELRMRNLELLLDIASLCLVFIADEDSRVERNYKTDRDSVLHKGFRHDLSHLLVRTWMLIYDCVKRLALQKLSLVQSNELLSDISFVLHDELGTRGFCNALDGAFLNMIEDEVFRMNRVENENDLVQVLHCRYGISFESGSFYPWDHGTQATRISAQDASRILPFIKTFIPKRADGLVLPKQDLRHALEVVHDALQAELGENIAYTTNKETLEDWFDSPVEVYTVKQALQGRLRLSPKAVDFDNVDGAVAEPIRDLSSTIGKAYLGQMRSRTKTALPNPKNLEDLDEAIAYFLLDVQLNPEKRESWVQLAKLYVMLTDEELSISSDHILARQDEICIAQKRAVMCSLVAISMTRQALTVDAADDALEKQWLELLGELGQLLVDIVEGPLELVAFRGTREDEADGSDKVESDDDDETSGMSSDQALACAAKCLTTAAKKSPDAWQYLCALGQVHHRLGLEVEAVLPPLIHAAQEAPTKPVGDGMLVLEPHSALVGILLELYNSGRVTPEQVSETLLQIMYGQAENFDIDPAEHIELTIEHLRAADKRHWHHRPAYEQSRLHFALACQSIDEAESWLHLQKARELFETLMSQKGPVQSILSIWRTGFERPGQHFLYMEKYSLYYADLLFRLEDMDSVRSFLKRVKRDSANIWNHREVWHELFDRYMDQIVASEDLDIGIHLELLAATYADDMRKVSARLETASALAAFPEHKMLKVLRDLYDMRKVNGGLFETTEVDNLILDLYTTLYNRVQEFDDVALGLAKPTIAAGDTSLIGADNSLIGDQSIANDIDPAAAAASAGPVLTAATLFKSRTTKAKEPKNVKVTRKDLLLKAFALCKPKSSAAESGNTTRAAAVSTALERKESTLEDDAHAEDDTLLARPESGVREPTEPSGADNAQQAIDAPVAAQDADMTDGTLL